MITSLTSLGTALHATGEGNAAQVIFDEAIALAEPGMMNRFELTDALVAKASTRLADGDLSTARELLTRAIDICERCEFNLRRGQAMTALARVSYLEGDREQAGHLATDALATQNATGYVRGQAEAHEMLALAFPASADEHTAAVEICQRTGIVLRRWHD